jgi:hypothetical protein
MPHAKSAPVTNRWFQRLVEAALLLVAIATTASAQSAHNPSPTGFVFEVHFGSMPTALPSSGVSSPLPLPEGAFTTVDGGPSRQVPSWFFGDGASLANQVAGQLGQSLMVPLDPVLTSASMGRNRGADLGIRIGHTITRYVLFTVAYDRAGGHLALSPAASTAVVATNASFQPYWTALLTRPNTANVAAASVATINDNVGTEQLLTFVAEIRPVSIDGWRPYVAFGGGLALPSADMPTVVLSGQYQFTLVNPGVGNDGAQLAQTDQVQVTYKTQVGIIKVFGGGVEKDLMAHLGFRIDLRAFLGANLIDTRLDSQNATLSATPGKTVVIRRAQNPELQIGSFPAAQSSLSGQGVSHLVTFQGTGKLTSVTAGFFVRF